MICYRIYENTITVDGKESESYGVAAFDENGEIIGCAPDITTVRSKAEYILEKCRRNNASPCHLKDIAEDFIISDEY